MFLKNLQNSRENIYVRVPFLKKSAYNFIKKESLAQVFSCKVCEKVFLKNSRNSRENIYARVSFLKRLKAGLQLY